ncbi:cytochrome C biogenesis protein [Lacibacter luteus]|uniref:Cytochrome C biogenesis protein n=1 Tax=Lacibacter luteus TaxID=2508719 RepID=A0A4Q1CN34_9BACT|nr:heme exporter protein CcmB [Lacibacter luteus]RXK62470.1 cytochrome C biogenesis protein [Lacibacter luteus]
MISAQKIATLFKKDLLLEIRQQYTFYGILLYIACTVYILFLAVNEPDASVWNALFWVNMLFISINAVAKSFLQESRGRMLYYYSIASPQEFILAKLFYNVLLMLVMSLLSLLTFGFFLGAPFLHALQFTGITILGGVSMSLVFTLLAAIASRANQNAAIMVIMGFPIIIPQLLLLIRISKAAFGEMFKDGAVLQMVLLLGGLDVLVLALCMILFPFLWKD